MKKKRINDTVLASIPVQNGQILKGEHLAILREILSAAINENNYDIDRIVAGQDAVHVYGADVEALNDYVSENPVAHETLGYLYTENQILLYIYEDTNEWRDLGVLNLTELFNKTQELDAHIEDEDNPHEVTAEQVDTYNKSTIDNKDAGTLQVAKEYTDVKISEEVTSEKVKQLYEANPDTNAYTDEDKNKVEDHLTEFNEAEKLVQLDASGRIPGELIEQDFDDYLKRDGSSEMSGDLEMADNAIREVTYIGFGEGSVSIASGAGYDLILTASSVKLNTDLDYQGFKAINLEDPTDPQDGATKSWVQQLVSQGTHVIAAVRAATPGSVSSLSGLVTIDGVALNEGDRVLVRAQTTPAENGVYIVNSGAWTKLPNDSDKGSLVTVLEGTAQKRHQYYNQNGTTWVLYWVDDDYHATVNGGLELDGSGLGFGIKPLGVTNAMLAGSIDQGKIAPFTALDDELWGLMPAATASVSLSLRMDGILSAIRSLRGTGFYNTPNTQTISDLYANKQDKLVAGDNITINPTTNVISASGGGNLNDYIPKTDVANNLTTTDAGKVLDARQGKVLDDGKLNKDTSVTEHAKVMVKSADGTNNSFAVDVRQTYSPDAIVQRKINSLIPIISGDTESRPTTVLNAGDLYFNTELGCLEVYDGTTWVSLTGGDVSIWRYE